MEARSVLLAPLRGLIALLAIVAMLIVELVLTVLVYTGLNLHNFELFGQLVRFAGSVLEYMSALMERVFSGSANSAYASLFGELGPKSMLLLLIGLVVAALVRVVVTLVRSLVRSH